MIERVRGQTADLPWSLRVDANLTLSDASEAIAVGERFDADVVIWFDVSSENRVEVNAVEVATQSDFRRPIELDGKETRLSASAMVEATALAVRSLLIALDRKQERETASQAPLESTSASRSSTDRGNVSIQTSTAERSLVESADVVTQSSESTGTAASPVSETSVKTSASNAAQWQFAVGWHFVADGVSPAGQHGPHLRLGFNIDRLQLALLGYLTFPAAIESDELTIDLQRYSLLASLGYELLSQSEFRLSIAVAGGVLSISRSTSVHVSGLTPTPDATVNSLVVQWDTRVQWFPVWVERMAGLEFAADLAVIPASVDFGIQQGQTVVDRKASWVVQPSFCLSFVLRIN